MLCRSSVISSTLSYPHLAGVPSLTFSAVAIQSLEDKDRGWGLMGTAQLISFAYLLAKYIPLTCNLAHYFSPSHNSFSPRVNNHPHHHYYQLYSQLCVAYYEQTASGMHKLRWFALFFWCLLALMFGCHAQTVVSF